MVIYTDDMTCDGWVKRTGRKSDGVIGGKKLEAFDTNGVWLPAFFTKKLQVGEPRQNLNKSSSAFT